MSIASVNWNVARSVSPAAADGDVHHVHVTSADEPQGGMADAAADVRDPLAACAAIPEIIMSVRRSAATSMELSSESFSQ
jgi:hypothetical protein